MSKDESIDEPVANELTANERTTGEPTANEPTANELAANEPTADELTMDELTTDEIARLAEVFAQVPYARLLGMKFVTAERGAATFALDTREELTRMGGILHGGAIVSLLDTAAAFAVHTLLEPFRRTVTVDLTVHFLRPVGSGRVEARARVLRAGHRVVIISVEATDTDGELVATATTTYIKQGAGSNITK